MLRRRRAATGLAVVGALVAVAVSAASLGSPASQRTARAASAGTIPSPVTPAFQPGAPQRLGPLRHVSVWAPVGRPVTVRAAPAADAAAVTRLETTTPEATRNVVAVLERRQDRTGRTWARVALAILPNGSTGWVPRSALGGYGTLRTRLDVDLGRLEATLYRDGRAILRAPIGVGGATTPTPTGRFYVRNRLSRYSSPMYGPVAFGTSARSPTATDWPAGGFVGIHGTDRPDLLPGRISHGCIRMRNADIVALARLMPVGTPVHIR